MKIKHILLVALAALALSLASIGATAPAIADAIGGHGGNAGAPTIAGGKVVGSDF